MSERKCPVCGESTGFISLLHKIQKLQAENERLLEMNKNLAAMFQVAGAENAALKAQLKAHQNFNAAMTEAYDEGKP
jgi:hypothetical protein